eukprot:403333781
MQTQKIGSLDSGYVAIESRKLNKNNSIGQSENMRQEGSEYQTYQGQTQNQQVGKLQQNQFKSPNRINSNQHNQKQMSLDQQSKMLKQTKSSAILQPIEKSYQTEQPAFIRKQQLPQEQSNKNYNRNSDTLLQQSNQVTSQRLIKQYQRLNSMESVPNEYNQQLHNNNQFMTDRGGNQNNNQSKIIQHDDRLEQRANKMRQKLSRDQKRIQQQQDLGHSSMISMQESNFKTEFENRRKSNQSQTKNARDHISNQVHDMLVSTPISQFSNQQQNLQRNQSTELNPLTNSRNAIQTGKHSVNQNLINFQAEQILQQTGSAENLSLVRNLRGQFKSSENQISMDSIDQDFEGASAHLLVAPDENESQNYLLGSHESLSSQRKTNKLESQYKINLPKVNKRGIQIVISKDQTQTIVGNIQKLNHKFQNKTIKLETILPNSSQTISKRNFERNLKNANEEIQRLRRELNEKNKILDNISTIDPSSQRVGRDTIQSSANARDLLGAQTKSLTRDVNTQMQHREYTISGLDLHSERKTSENTFRVRKVKLQRQNTENELTRASSQPVLISRRNIIFKKDQDQLTGSGEQIFDYQLKNQQLINDTTHQQYQSVDVSNRIGSANNLQSVLLMNNTVKSLEETPLSKQSQLPQIDKSQKSLRNKDPRFRKFKGSIDAKLPTQQIIDSPKQLTQEENALLKTTDLDILEERDENEEDGDKLTREGFYKNQQASLDSQTLRIKKQQSSQKRLAVNQSNQGLTTSQMKSTAVTMKQQNSDWNATSSQSKFNSIITPKNNRASQIQGQKNETSFFNYTSKDSQTMGRRNNKSQNEKQIKPVLKNNKIKQNQNSKQIEILNQDHDRLINPVNDELETSPIQSFDPSQDEEPYKPLIDLKQNFKEHKKLPQVSTPKRGQQIKKTKDKLKSSFELLQEIQKNEQKLPNTQQIKNLSQFQDSPAFGHEIENSSNFINTKTKTFEYQQNKEVQDFSQEFMHAQNNGQLLQASNKNLILIQSTNLQNQTKPSKMNTIKPLVKRLEVFYEDDIDDDEYNPDFNSPSPNKAQQSFDDNQNQIFDENADVSFDNIGDDETPQIFSDTLYTQNNNKFIQQQQLDSKEGNLINPFALNTEEDNMQESMDFMTSLGSKKLFNDSQVNSQQDNLNLRSSTALILDRNNNLRASAQGKTYLHRRGG